MPPPPIPSLPVHRSGLLLLLSALLMAWPSAAHAWPGLPSAPLGGKVSAFEGAAATPAPFPAPPAPAHPHLAAGEFSNIHNDAWMTDANQGPGPLGRDLRVRSAFYAGECGTVTFDRRGRLVSVCVRLDRPSLTVMNPATLAPLATHDLPAKARTSAAGLTDVSGGGYFYLDADDRAVIPTADRRLRIVAIEDDARGRPRLRRIRDVVLGLDRAEKVVAVMPDWDGRIWFVTTGGIVGTFDEATGAVRRTALGEGITNSIAVDADGSVYVVSDRALYRMRADTSGAPSVLWRAAVPERGPAQDGAVRRRLGNNADHPARRARRDHRQRRPDGRRGLPDRRRHRGLPGPGLLGGRQRHRQLAHRRRPDARRRQQLRLRGPARRAHAAPHGARARPHRRRCRPQRLPPRVERAGDASRPR